MTASLQPETTSPSRRALLAGALGGIGALAASAIGRASPVRGADGQAVAVGGEYAASSATGFTTTTSTALYGTSSTGIGVNGNSDSLVGVSGHSDSDAGVFGHSTMDVGVYGRSLSNTQPALLGQSVNNSTGVLGVSSNDVAPPAAKAKTGVYGYAAQDNFSRGVIGESPAGIGVYGISSTGYGGYFGGRVYTTQFYELSEVGTPAAPLANRARLFLKDNGAGKTQLCVRFHTGAVKILAIES